MLPHAYVQHIQHAQHAQHGSMHTECAIRRCMSDVKDLTSGSRKAAAAYGKLHASFQEARRLRPSRLVTSGSFMNQSNHAHHLDNKNLQNSALSDVPKLPSVPFVERLKHNGGVPLPHGQYAAPRNIGDLAAIGNQGEQSYHVLWTFSLYKPCLRIHIEHHNCSSTFRSWLIIST